MDDQLLDQLREIASTPIYGKCGTCGNTVYGYADTTAATLGPFNNGQDCWHLYYNGATDDDEHLPTFTPTKGATR